MDVIIFSGQSNMCGETDCFPSENQPVTGAYEYHYATNALDVLMHPVGEDLFDGMLEGSVQKRGSLVPAFCRAYIKKTQRNVTAVHVARGSSCIAQWQPEAPRYACLKKKVLAALEKVQETNIIEHVYFVWLQGESDALRQTTAQDYLKYLLRLKEELKKDFGIKKFAIIKVGYFAANANWVTGDPEEKIKWDETIMSAQEEAVEKDPDMVMLTRMTTQLSQDPQYINPYVSGHYNNQALDMIGTASGDALADVSMQEDII